MLPLQFGADPKLDTSQNDDQQRKLRRKLSNRLSARRSRMRKQSHLEDLRCHVSRFKAMNGELSNRVGLLTQQTMFIQSDNQRLRSEQRILQYRLSKILQVLLFNQSVCGFGSGINEQGLGPLIA